MLQIPKHPHSQNRNDYLTCHVTDKEYEYGTEYVRQGLKK